MARLEEYERRLQLYYDAELAILDGAQSYSIGSRQLTRGSLGEIRKMIEYLLDKIEEEKAIASGKKRNKVVGAVPFDW